MRDFIRVTRALADPSRVRVLLALRRGELCVCQISELFRLAPSTMSKHLAMLHQAGLVQSRKVDRWVYYRLPNRKYSALAREILGLVRRSLKDCDEAVADATKLKKVLKMDVQDICRRQCR